MRVNDLREMLFCVVMKKTDVYRRRYTLSLFCIKRQIRLERWGHMEELRSLIETFRLEMIANGAVRYFCKAG